MLNIIVEELKQTPEDQQRVELVGCIWRYYPADDLAQPAEALKPLPMDKRG